MKVENFAKTEICYSYNNKNSDGNGKMNIDKSLLIFESKTFS